MPINNLDYVANQPIIDTYAPLPYKEMQDALNQKQLKYDTEEKKLADMPAYLKANIKPTYTDTQGNTFRNAAYDQYLSEATDFNNKINETTQTLSSTSDPHEVKKLTSRLANDIANWKLNKVKPAEDESANYEGNWKKLQEDKNKGKEPYRAYQHDLAVRSQANRDLSKGYVPVGFKDQLDYSDINKNLADAATKVPLNETTRKSFKEHITQGGSAGFLNWEKSNGNNAQAIRSVIQPILEEQTPHIKAELIHTLGNNPKYYNDMVNQGYDPNNENDILKYARDSETTQKLKQPNGKSTEVKSNLLQDFFNKKRMEYTSAALGFTKAKDEYKDSFDESAFLNKKQEETSSNTGYTPTNPIDTDLINFKYDSDKVKDLSFKDYIQSIGESKSFMDKHDLDSEVQKGFKFKDKENTKMIDYYNNLKQKRELTSDEKTLLTRYKGEKERQDKKNTIFEQYQLFKDIDKLSDKDFSKKMSEVNPIAKAITTQLGDKNISKKDLLERLKTIENQKNLSGVSINLREKEADNQWYSLFGKKDEGGFNNAKSLKWTDRNTGETTNFDSIEIDGTKIKDLDPDEIIKYKKEGRIGIPKFEYPIASKGGQSVEIDGKTYVTGGETFKEKSELKPMSTVNTVLKQPLQTANNNGYGEIYEYKSKETDPFISKQYGVNPTAIQGYTDYKTLQNYVIIYGEGNKIVGKIPLDEYNKGTIQEVGSGFVQPDRIKGLD